MLKYKVILLFYLVIGVGFLLGMDSVGDSGLFDNCVLPPIRNSATGHKRGREVMRGDEGVPAKRRRLSGSTSESSSEESLPVLPPLSLLLNPERSEDVVSEPVSIAVRNVPLGGVKTLGSAEVLDEEDETVEDVGIDAPIVPDLPPAYSFGVRVIPTESWGSEEISEFVDKAPILLPDTGLYVLNLEWRLINDVSVLRALEAAMRRRNGKCLDFRCRVEPWVALVRPVRYEIRAMNEAFNKFLEFLGETNDRRLALRVLCIKNFETRLDGRWYRALAFNIELLKRFKNLTRLSFALTRNSEIKDCNFFGAFPNLNNLEVYNRSRNENVWLLYNALRQPRILEVTWGFLGPNSLMHGSESIVWLRFDMIVNFNVDRIRKGRFLHVDQFPSLKELYFDCCKNVTREDLEMGVRAEGFGQIHVFWRNGPQERWLRIEG